MDPIIAAKWLVASGCLAIFMSCLFGVAMIIPLQKPQNGKGSRANLKHLGAAHVDWILLGLMSAAAGGLAVLFDLHLGKLVIWAIIFGAWANPLPYVWRAFGVNAFQFSGSLVQRGAALMGGLSSLAIIVAWGAIFFALGASMLTSGK